MWLHNLSNLLFSGKLPLEVYIYFISATLAAHYKQSTTVDWNFVTVNVFQGELGFHERRYEKEGSLNETTLSASWCWGSEMPCSLGGPLGKWRLSCSKHSPWLAVLSWIHRLRIHRSLNSPSPWVMRIWCWVVCLLPCSWEQAPGRRQEHTGQSDRPCYSHVGGS